MKNKCVTEGELKRYWALMEVKEGRISLKEASEVLGLSYRHTLRLRDRFEAEGFEGLLRRAPAKPPNEKISSETRQKIISLRKETYKDLNILHFRD
jgi:transposase